jgi:hypothetical protein
MGHTPLILIKISFSCNSSENVSYKERTESKSNNQVTEHLVISINRGVNTVAKPIVGDAADPVRSLSNVTVRFPKLAQQHHFHT